MLFLLLAFCSLSLGQEIVYEWETVTFAWPNATIQQQYTANKKYISKNNVVTGIKLYQDTIFVSVPRWRPGVPITLAQIDNSTGSPLLKAFPNFDGQQVGNCNNIQYVQSMIIDSKGIMWVIDVGMRNQIDPGTVDYTCRPKLLLIDIATGQTQATLVLDEATAPNGTFLNDIVLNEAIQTAYVSDTGLGSIITFDMANKKAWRFQHPSMNGNPVYRSLPYQGYLFNITNPEDGIAISPDKQYIYYCPLTSVHLHRVTASLLNDPAKAAESVRTLGMRPSWADGLIIDSNGTLYYGVQSEYAVYSWDTSLPMLTENNQKVVFMNNVTNQWVDTFDIQGGYLWWTSNRLPQYFLTITDPTEVNMRIFKMPLN